MMKRPRSLIATLLVLLCLGAPLAGISATPTESLAGPAGSRLMNPRAGDPDQPDDGAAYMPGGSGSYSPSDPARAVEGAPSIKSSGPGVTSGPWSQANWTLLSLLLEWRWWL